MGRGKPPPWKAEPGNLARYVGRAGRLLRGGRMVKILAEARGKRVVVEAIGHNGTTVRFTVNRENLGQPQPGLFD